MIQRMNVHLASAALVLTSVVVTTAETPRQLPTRYTNLQVLPKETDQDQLIGLMKNVTMALGVRCSYCHQGTGDDLSVYDFAADVKEPKATARTMLRMTSQLNSLLKDVGPHKGDTSKVTCQTCHRGKTTPAK
jgi:hypothetical protein